MAWWPETEGDRVLRNITLAAEGEKATWELGKALDSQPRLSVFILGRWGAIEGHGEVQLLSRGACGFGVAVRSTGTPRQRLLLNRPERMKVGGNFPEEECQWEEESGRRSVSPSTGVARKKSPRQAQCLLFSVTVCFVT